MLGDGLQGLFALEIDIDQQPIQTDDSFFGAGQNRRRRSSPCLGHSHDYSPKHSLVQGV